MTLSQTISDIVSDNKCHKQKWRVLFFTCIKLVACVLACVSAIARIKWKRVTYLLMICQKSKSMVSPPMKYEGISFWKKLFRVDGEKIFLDKFIEDCSTWWINDQIMPLAREFHKRISSALKTVNLNFPQLGRSIHLKIKPRPVYRIIERFILEVNG